jgi:hypothetical protein
VQNSRPVGFQKIACFFEKIDQLIALREPKVKFIYGDQHDLKMLKTECATQVVDIAMQLILQAKASAVADNIKGMQDKFQEYMLSNMDVLAKGIHDGSLKLQDEIYTQDPKYAGAWTFLALSTTSLDLRKYLRRRSLYRRESRRCLSTSDDQLH